MEYTAVDYRRDPDTFCRFMRINPPEILPVGHCPICVKEFRNADPSNFPTCEREALLAGTREKLDVYSYHYYNYNETSERIAAVGGHWAPGKDKNAGFAYPVCNCDGDNAFQIELPAVILRYTLAAASLRSSVLLGNGIPAIWKPRTNYPHSAQYKRGRAS